MSPLEICRQLRHLDIELRDLEAEGRELEVQIRSGTCHSLLLDFEKLSLIHWQLEQKFAVILHTVCPRYNAVFVVHDNEPHYKRGALNSMLPYLPPGGTIVQ